MLARIIRPGTQEHNHALKLFDLTPIIFQDIGVRIFAGFNQATLNDARTAPGSFAYFAGIRALRDICIPLGWKLHREGNIEMILASSGQFAITASSGDKNTGSEKAEPETRNSKGRQTSEIVYKNQDYDPWLFPQMDPIQQADFDPEKTPTWFLLYHIDFYKNEVRMELSLPIDINHQNMKIDKWKERILLSAVRFDDTPINRDNEREFYSDFDIEIKRKSNE